MAIQVFIQRVMGQVVVVFYFGRVRVTGQVSVRFMATYSVWK